MIRGGEFLIREPESIFTPEQFDFDARMMATAATEFMRGEVLIDQLSRNSATRPARFVTGMCLPIKADGARRARATGRADRPPARLPIDAAHDRHYNQF